MSDAIRIRGLERSFRRGNATVKALRGLDLAISEGEFIALVGPSGSGKSTLLNLLGGLDNKRYTTVIKRFLRQKNKTEEVVLNPVPVETQAPEFVLASDSGDSLTLSDFRGRPVVLVFYPADNTSVCASQLALYNEAYHMFDEHDAQLLAISVDDQASHQEFARQLGLRFPLLSDDDPFGKTARAYGVYDEEDQVAERALFVLDTHGTVSWRYVAPRGVNPGANGILEALESLEQNA